MKITSLFGLLCPFPVLVTGSASRLPCLGWTASLCSHACPTSSLPPEPSCSPQLMSVSILSLCCVSRSLTGSPDPVTVPGQLTVLVHLRSTSAWFANCHWSSPLRALSTPEELLNPHACLGENRRIGLSSVTTLGQVLQSLQVPLTPTTASQINPWGSQNDVCPHRKGLQMSCPPPPDTGWIMKLIIAISSVDFLLNT